MKDGEKRTPGKKGVAGVETEGMEADRRGERVLQGSGNGRRGRMMQKFKILSSIIFTFFYPLLVVRRDRLMVRDDHAPKG